MRYGLLLSSTSPTSSVTMDAAASNFDAGDFVTLDYIQQLPPPMPSERRVTVDSLVYSTDNESCMFSPLSVDLNILDDISKEKIK